MTFAAKYRISDGRTKVLHPMSCGHDQGVDTDCTSQSRFALITSGGFTWRCWAVFPILGVSLWSGVWNGISTDLAEIAKGMLIP